MDDDQLKNAIAAIKSRISSASSLAELAKISIEAGGLNADSPEMENQLKAIQDTIAEKVEKVQSAQASQNISSGEKGRDYVDADKDKDLDKLAAANDKIYKSFNDTHKDHLSRKESRTKNLNAALQATQAGEPISEELRNSLKKSDQQKKEEREHNKKLAAVMKAAKGEEERSKAAINEIDSEIGKPSQSQEQIQALQQRRKQHVDRLDVVNGEMQKGNAELDACLVHAENIHSGRKAAKTEEDKTFWVEQQNDFWDSVASVVDKGILLERAKEKGGGTVASLSELIKDQEVMQELLHDAVKETIRQDPKAAEKLRELLDQNTQINDTSGPKSPPNTPNVKLPDKGPGLVK